MKLRFRSAILSILIGLIVAAVATVGICSYVYTRLAAEDLSEQVIEQVSLGIDQQVENLLGNAIERNALSAKLLESGQLSKEDLGGLLRFWARSLETSPGTTSSFIGLAKTGESAGVSRLQDGQLSVWQTTPDVAPNSLRLREYRWADYPRSPFREQSGSDVSDVRGPSLVHRRRPSGWSRLTESYVFLGVGKVKQVLGLTYATPLLGPDRRLDSVISVDFDLETLCRYLKGLKVGRDGFAFIVENRADGPRVIAHPRPEILAGSAGQGGGRPRRWCPSIGSTTAGSRRCGSNPPAARSATPTSGRPPCVSPARGSVTSGISDASRGPTSRDG